MRWLLLSLLVLGAPAQAFEPREFFSRCLDGAEDDWQFYFEARRTTNRHKALRPNSACYMTLVQLCRHADAPESCLRSSSQMVLDVLWERSLTLPTEIIADPETRQDYKIRYRRLMGGEVSRTTTKRLEEYIESEQDDFSRSMWMLYMVSPYPKLRPETLLLNYEASVFYSRYLRVKRFVIESEVNAK